MLFWLLGLVSSYTMGGFIHLLLVIAIVVIVIQVIHGRRFQLKAGTEEIFFTRPGQAGKNRCRTDMLLQHGSRQ